MFPILQIGGLALQVPGLILLVGLWIGLLAAERRAARFDIPAEALYNLVFFGLAAGLAGGRMAYAGLHPEPFLRNPLGLFSLRPELLDPLGALAAGILAAWITVRRASLPPARILDALTPFFAVVLMAVPAAHFASGTGYGEPANLPWAVDLWGTARHPVQVYEFLAGAGVCFWLARAVRLLPDERLGGELFLNFVVLTALSRVFLGAFRADAAVIGTGLRAAQVSAWGLLAAGLAGLWWIRNGKTGAISES